MADTLTFSQNEDAYKLLLTKLERKLADIYDGGGKKKKEKLHQEGKLSARERVALLLDKGAEWLEIGAFAAYGMYEADGGCPAAGVVCGIGRVSGTLCMIVANDATVKAGAWFPMTGKKNLRAQEIAMENHIPIIYLVDSAGVYLPMQDEIFPDKEHFGRIFRNNARMSSMGIPQIAAVMGSCVAGGAYLPIMSDEALIVDKTGSIFLAGPYLVKAAIGENIDSETLGGATTHSEISGIIDHKMPDDTSCLERIRMLVKGMGKGPVTHFNRIPSVEPAEASERIYGVFPYQSNKPYDIHDILASIVDRGSMIPYKEDYGKTIACVYARIDGWSVGIVANNREIVKTGKGEMQFGGVIYSDSADKATRFILNCNQKNIPLVFVQDVTGFMVGSRSEHGGIIKDGAKMVNAVANSTVPKFTIIIGNSYGAGNYAMCGKAYDPRLILAWPTSKIAVMGGQQAARVLAEIQVNKLKSQGQEVDPEAEQTLYDKIKNRYDEQESAYYAAARLWVDAIISPIHTREWISIGIEMSSYAKVEKFNVGVIQV
ncbi:MAG: acyl-CoA carboxylase subunit beta [Saprospiraceae bacterium]|jgi:acetyl-CoA carboxylase carboxyltransferase component|nr:acyl-CoA carboxylase subunit beta [Saprospiraceae bacterium]MBK7436207.1 acyl-CoA carboxylase subunit beta [Saprospiraceae bacterium]MBK8281361.1 acyl-CoA carboxylase subunit beta [Saprospiraceae bacterium]MBK8514334.1 acyl-CoA carboxylase subunit beta [Saprospiraceae bacterium]MBK9929256.1 acyl-CoA carboxylase subunit beta [Saprospiraceae bacterium]